MKALIVEPTLTYKLLLQSLFNDRSCETVLVSSGQEGFAALEEISFDLVCVALHLEDMTGIDFCRTLRAEGKKTLPIVMMTSEEEKRIFEEGMAAGVTEIFRKEDLLAITKYLTTFKAQHLAESRLEGTVLCVTDNVPLSSLLQTQLSRMGLKIEQTRLGEHAFEKFETSDYDLIITDTLLAGPMSGFALVREVRQGPLKKRMIPILVLSSFKDDGRKIETLRSGANDYVSKPVLEAELAARVRNLITNKKLLDQVEAQQVRLEEMAMTDSLTTLYNRHCLNEIAPGYISEAGRHDLPLSLVVMDLDDFKHVNDTYGHHAGDQVLIQIADLLKKSCRQEDIAARFGGEEFLLLLPYCNGQDAAKKAEVLRRKIEALEPNGIQVTASFGVCQLPGGNLLSFEEIFGLADKALYDAKNGGRNLVVLSQEDEGF
ncbi:diguanylate cyclase/phosphodiesterase (GGDEF & EAL domains) with PAS/PAC sensor(s) [hydrothermal vent metagenome]|uniref:Diguanylate cyclase/phosphodiesterase (GGDEF & EAL domains) with PAS/PAC sensor(S) n=1 Tax=hydrothermal vent metagenome TaxID=652676 RepID=A0A3B1DBZ1_9ZZZZ